MNIVLQRTSKTPKKLKLPENFPLRLEICEDHTEKQVTFDNIPARFRNAVMTFKTLNHLRLTSLLCNCGCNKA